MKYSIRSKLTIFSVCIVLVSVLLISVPVVNIEFSKQQKNLYDVAELQMGNAYSSINEFLVKPESIVETMKSVLELKSFEKEESEALFADSIKNDENFYVLYYTNNIPIKDGGFMYSGDGWEPPSDYDQTKSGWFIEGFGKPQTVITSPYVDEESGSVVTTVLANVNAAGNRRGVVCLDIMLDTIKQMVDSVKLTKSGKTYLLQEDGLYITNEDSSKILQANFFTDNSVFNQYKKRETLTSSFISLSQKDGYYYASRKISDKAGWVIVTHGPVSELYSSVYKDIYLIISVAIIALILAFIVSIFVAGKIAKPIKVVDENVNEIASGKADLSRHIAVSSHDEVGSLVNGFNLFVDKLADIVRQLKASKTDLVNIDGSLQESISQASEAIKKILGNIKKVGNEVAGQSQAVTQTSAAVAEIAENINSLERMIENQSRGVSDASSAVEQMIGNISSVNNSMDKMAMSFEKLAESAQNGANLQVDANEKIERIKDQSETLQEANLAIAAIAEQTNLLAMNAAIEAAHAGEAGKGFSVVADEIRKLSETSSEQSKTIGNELTQIRVSIESMVNASQQSSEAFHTVTTKIQETDQLVRQIKAAMEEQQEGSKQIVDALKTMNDSTSEVRVASHEMLEGNQLILVEVQNLQDTTFHIKDSMSEMEASAEEINGTSVNLFNISSSVKASVEKIGNEIDEFNA